MRGTLKGLKEWKRNVDEIYRIEENKKWEMIERGIERKIQKFLINYYEGEIFHIIHITSLNSVFKGFDFDFCKVWYDGKNFHAACPESVSTLSCVVPNSIVRRRVAHLRIPKYQSRGFSISYEEESD